MTTPEGYINATEGILVFHVEHATIPKGELVPLLDEALYVVRVRGAIHGGGEREETLLLRPRVAAQLFVGLVVAAERTGTTELFTKYLSERMRAATNGRANVGLIRLDRLDEN